MIRDLFITGSANMAKKRTFFNKGNQIIPAGMVDSQPILADHPKYLGTMRELAEELSSKFTPDIDDLGVSGKNGVTGDFLPLRTVSGYRMQYRTLPPRSNEILRKQELGLEDGFVTPRHRAIFEELCGLMFTTWVPGDLSISKISSTGFPFFMTDPKFKKDLFIYIGQNLETILNLWDQGKLDELYSRFHFVVCNYLSDRSQVDKVTFRDGKYFSKDREVNDWDYAKSGGQSGSRFVSSKAVVADGQAIPGHFAMRVRTVYAMSACINYILAGVFNGFRNHYLYEYGFTWKHTTREQIFEKISKYNDVVGVDVKQYDQSFGKWFFEWWVDYLAQHSLDERLARLIFDAISAPYYSTHPEVGKKGGFWLGNPLDKSTFNLQVGLPSGVAPNPDLGKLGFTGAMLCAIDDYSHDVLGNVAKILKGEHPIFAILNMGDDSLLMSNSQGLTQYLRDRLNPDLKDKLSPYFLAEKEDSISFLGNVLHKRYDGSRALVPNIRSFMFNWFCPERGIDARTRHFWPIGWTERQHYYSPAPVFGEVLDITERKMRDKFGISMDAIAAKARASLRLPKMPVLSHADQIVLEDPAKLYYRIDPKLVSRVILDDLICSVPEQIATPIIRPFLRGNVL